MLGNPAPARCGDINSLSRGELSLASVAGMITIDPPVGAGENDVNQIQPASRRASGTPSRPGTAGTDAIQDLDLDAAKVNGE